jgi:transcriptional regulator with XRE-family HTH domain
VLSRLDRDDLVEADRPTSGAVALTVKLEKIVIFAKPDEAQDRPSSEFGCVGFDPSPVDVNGGGHCSLRSPGVALVEHCCQYSTPMLRSNSVATVEHVNLDERRFLSAIDRKRAEDGLSWRELARELGLSASTLSRLARGRRPDLETFLRLLGWLDQPAELFLVEPRELDETAVDTLSEIQRLFSRDPSLRPEDADALHEIVHAAYRRLRQ